MHPLSISSRRHGIPEVIAFCALLGGLLGQPAAADTYWVGSGAGCTHATLDAALAAALANGPGSDFVRIAAPTVSLGSIVSVTDDWILIEGGYDFCTDPTPDSTSDITVSGAHDAFWVHGTNPSSLYLRSVRVLMGPSAGRVLKIEGQSEVHVDGSTLLDGQAPEGGNVWISGANASIWVERRTRIAWGNATSGNGGGIYCEVGARVWLQDRAFVTENTAFLSGGGLYLDDCELQWSSHIAGNPTDVSEIAENASLHGDGGGIAAVGGSYVAAFGSEPTMPAILNGNYAGDGGRGGAIYVAGSGTHGGLVNVHVSQNTANGEGGGLFIDSGAELEMELWPATCSIGRGCSELVENRSQSSAGGGAFVAAGGHAWIRRTSIHRNFTVTSSSGAALAAYGPGALLVVEGNEIYDNDPNSFSGVESPQIFAGNSASLTVAFSTIVEATAAPGMAVFNNANAASLRLLSSVVQAPHTFTLPPPPATQVHCVITRETASLPPSAQAVVVVTNPALIFRLSTPEDYSIFRHSEAQDFCDTSQWDPWTSDIEGQDRGYDDPTFINILGPFDVGADEWRPEVFADGFESGDLGSW